MSAKQKKVLWPVLIIMVAALTAVVFANARKGGHKDFAAKVSMTHEVALPPTKAAGTAAVTTLNPTIQGLALRGPTEIVRFTVYEAGMIRPREAHASPGLVAIHIEDQSKSSGGLVVERESAAGISLGQVIRSVGSARGEIRMRLAPGRYKIHDATRPRNWATLIVEP